MVYDTPPVWYSALYQECVSDAEEWQDQMERETRLNLKRLARKLDRARNAEAAVWDELRALMKQAHEDEGGTFSEIGEATGVTKARVYQIVTGRRGGRKPADLHSSESDQDLISA